MTASVAHNNIVTGHAHNASLILIATRLIVWHLGQDRKGNENIVVLILCEPGIKRPKLLPQRGQTKLLSSDCELTMLAHMLGLFSNQCISYAWSTSPLLAASIHYFGRSHRTGSQASKKTERFRHHEEMTCNFTKDCTADLYMDTARFWRRRIRRRQWGYWFWNWR